MTGLGRPRPRTRSGGLAAAGLVVALVLAGGCGPPPDRPARLGRPLPDAVLHYLQPDSVRELSVAPGIRYRYLWSPAGPWAVHLLEVELDRCGVELAVVRAPGAPGTDTARTPVTGLMARAPSGAVAAVNGAFFTQDGTPLGPELSVAGLRALGEAPVFSWDPERGPWIGRARLVRDSLVEAGGWIAGSGRGEDGAALLSGFPELLDGGSRVGDLESRASPSFAVVRHPRTAVGYSAGSGRLWMVVVDGRQGAYSAGMSLVEVTELLEALGASEALNLDGGGSSVMVLGERAVSRPSDRQGERSVANALVVLSRAPRCPDPSGARVGGRHRPARPGE